MNKMRYVENSKNSFKQAITKRIKNYILRFIFGYSLLLSMAAQAGLVGTELSLSTFGQATPTSEKLFNVFERKVIVSSSIVEYPDVMSLNNPGAEVPPGFSGGLVDVAIDVGDNYIEIDFDNAGLGRFASAFENTYVFKFDSASVVDIIDAKLDSTVTTLGLDSSDVRFVENELFINVEGLSFNSSTFVRINLVATNSIPIECAEGQINPVLDIDGNCIVDALTDGLLIIRYMFGLKENSLIDGALAQDCTRCNSEEIILYLDNLSR